MIMNVKLPMVRSATCSSSSRLCSGSARVIGVSNASINLRRHTHDSWQDKLHCTISTLECEPPHAASNEVRIAIHVPLSPRYVGISVLLQQLQLPKAAGHGVCLSRIRDFVVEGVAAAMVKCYNHATKC